MKAPEEISLFRVHRDWHFYILQRCDNPGAVSHGQLEVYLKLAVVKQVMVVIAKFAVGTPVCAMRC